MLNSRRRTWNDGATALVSVVWLNGRRWTVVRGTNHEPGWGLVAVEPNPGNRRPGVSGRFVWNAR